MAFIPLNYEEGRVVLLPLAASITTTKGGAVVDNGSGFLTNAASSTAVDIQYVTAEAMTSGSSTGELVACWPTRGVRFVADCDAAPAQTDVGTHCDLATAATLNPDASTNDLFFIESIDTGDGAVGTSTKVTGYFAHGVLNS